MKYLNEYNDINWDDFDDEEEFYNGIDFKVGDMVLLPKGIPTMSSKESTIVRALTKGKINGEYRDRVYNYDKFGVIDKVVTRYDGVRVFRLRGEWPYREFTNWVKDD